MSRFVLLAALVAFAAACGQSKPEASATEDTLVVFAAASLRDVFTEVGVAFRRSHPGVELRLHFAGSQELRTQIEHGAACDVFASADQRHMDALVANKRAEQPFVFAENEPVIVVAKERSATLLALAELPSASRIVLGAAEVPIGRYARQILDKASQQLGADFRARVEAKVVSHELNVRQVLAKVSLGEADAGIVYRSDALTAKDRVAIVRIAPEFNVIAQYPIAALSDAAHPNLARAWLASIRAEAFQQALRRAGFIAPLLSDAAP